MPKPIWKTGGFIEALLKPLRIIHIIIAVIATVTAPAVSYVKFQGAVDKRFTESELKVEKEYAKKQDIREIKHTQTKIIELLHELKGEIKHLHHPRD